VRAVAQVVGAQKTHVRATSNIAPRPEAVGPPVRDNVFAVRNSAVRSKNAVILRKVVTSGNLSSPKRCHLERSERSLRFWLRDPPARPYGIPIAPFDPRRRPSKPMSQRNPSTLHLTSKFLVDVKLRQGLHPVAQRPRPHFWRTLCHRILTFGVYSRLRSRTQQNRVQPSRPQPWANLQAHQKSVFETRRS
jgi:hypothetical protein